MTAARDPREEKCREWRHNDRPHKPWQREPLLARLAREKRVPIRYEMKEYHNS